jgi:mono/diheme cytochrome c family protein
MTFRASRSATFVAGLAALTGVALFCSSPAMAANAQQGEVLAKRWCAACHLVSKDQTQGSTQAPPFSAIAHRPGFEAAQVALFLLDPHPKMPNMSLSRTEAVDLAAYIATQGK